jgi:hypothetical protein
MEDACAVGGSVAKQHFALLTIKGPTLYETVETPSCATTCAETTLNAKRYYTVRQLSSRTEVIKKPHKK